MEDDEELIIRTPPPIRKKTYVMIEPGELATLKQRAEAAEQRSEAAERRLAEAEEVLKFYSEGYDVWAVDALGYLSGQRAREYFKRKEGDSK